MDMLLKGLETINTVLEQYQYEVLFCWFLLPKKEELGNA
jgi:hypothetical protein